MEEIKTYIKKINILSKSELLELKELLEAKERNDWVIMDNGRRRVFCWLDEVEKRIREKEKEPINKKYGFKFGNLNIQAEKPHEIVAYNEPTFTPRETEADYNISFDDDQDKEDSWEIEEYTRKEKEREKEIMEDWKTSDDDYLSTLPTITTSDIIRENREKDREIERLRKEIEQLKLEKEQTAQIEQPTKK